ncbi:hypothetical protein, partial [Roseiconus lacunae]
TRMSVYGIDRKTSLHLIQRSDQDLSPLDEDARINRQSWLMVLGCACITLPCFIAAEFLGYTAEAISTLGIFAGGIISVGFGACGGSMMTPSCRQSGIIGGAVSALTMFAIDLRAFRAHGEPEIPGHAPWSVFFGVAGGLLAAGIVYTYYVRPFRCENMGATKSSNNGMHDESPSRG